MLKKDFWTLTSLCKWWLGNNGMNIKTQHDTCSPKLSSSSFTYHPFRICRILSENVGKSFPFHIVLAARISFLPTRHRIELSAALLRPAESKESNYPQEPPPDIGRLNATWYKVTTIHGAHCIKTNVGREVRWTQQAVPSSIQFYIDCTNQAISLYVMAAWTFPDPSSVFCCLAMTKVGETKTWSTKNMAAIQVTVPSKNQNMFEDIAHLLEAVACFYHLTVLMHDFRSGKMFWTRRLWPNKTFPDGTRQATWETTHLTESHISFFSPSFSHPNGMTLWLKIILGRSRSIEYVMFESPSKDSHKHEH